jgi:hypothetical protein
MKKKVLMLVVMLILVVAGVGQAKELNINLSGGSVLLGGEYFGAQAICDINNIDNLIFGLGRTKINDGIWEEEKTGVEIFAGKRFKYGKEKFDYEFIYEIGAGLNTEEGLVILATTNYPINKNWSAGITGHIRAGLMFNVSYTY